MSTKIEDGSDARTPQAYEIRSFRRGDRTAVRNICVATAWMGRPAPDRIIDEQIWADFWTRYFTDREPQHTWVVVRPSDSTVVGYLTGTMDARRSDATLPLLLPRMIWRVGSARLLRRSVSRSALEGLIRSGLRGELTVPASVQKRYPATLHLNLLEEARGRGVARQLFDRFVDQMRRSGIRGIHAQSLGDNARIARFNESVGFRCIASTPLHAYQFLDANSIQIHTWVMAI